MSFYKTGFLLNDDLVRRKQSLAPQQLSNDCKQPYNDNDYSLPLNANEVCNQTNLYPLKLAQLDYGSPTIPNTCSCTLYLQSP